MKNTLRVLALALCLLTLSSCGLAEITDSVLNEIGVYPIVKEPIHMTLGINASSYVIDYNTNYYTQALREVSGIDLEIIVFPEIDAETKLMLMVNGGSKLPDILGFGGSLRDQMADAGVLVALDDYFDKETGIADQFYAACERGGFDPEYILNMSRSPDGHIYSVPSISTSLTGMYNVRAYINREWMETLNLEMPTTLDELTEVLIAFRDGDPNGNGIKDEIPMTGSSASKMTDNANAMVWMQNLFIFRDRKENSFLPLNETDGKLDVCYDKEEYREFLKYMNMLVSEGLLDKAAFTQSTTEMRAQLQADTHTIGLMFGQAGSSSFGDYEDIWWPLAPLEGYNGAQYASLNKQDPKAYNMITTDCEHPEVAFMFSMMGYDNANNKLADIGRYGEEGVDWEYTTESTDPFLASIGMESSIKILTQDYWGVENNRVWNNVVMPQLTVTGPSKDVDMEAVTELYKSMKYEDGDVADILNPLGALMTRQYAPDSTNVVGTIIYTEEEANEWAEIRAAIKNYLIESSALFAVGQLDPNSDADWNNFLSDLTALQYKELLAVDQVAYNRTMGITK